MKKTIFTAIFILSFCLVTIGQESVCPTISVTGPPSATQPGETMTFTVIVGDLDWKKLEYDWSVDKGTIIEGQGTPVISVSTEGLIDALITASVEIKNLPDECEKSSSERGIVTGGHPVAFDDFEKLSKKDEKAHLYALASELKKRSEDSAYILLYHPTNDKSKSYADRVARIRNILIKDRNISAEKVVIIFAGEKTEERTRIYLVPSGAVPPTP